MGENAKLPIMIEYVNDLCQIWGMKRENLTKWLGTAESTISGWSIYKWAQVSKGLVRLVAIYYGESVKDEIAGEWLKEKTKTGIVNHNVVMKPPAVGSS